MPAIPVLCLHGAAEGDSACADLPRVKTLAIGAGHHFGGDYDRLAADVLAFEASAPRTATLSPVSSATAGPWLRNHPEERSREHVLHGNPPET
jgi:hypothetical protein